MDAPRCSRQSAKTTGVRTAQHPDTANRSPSSPCATVPLPVSGHRATHTWPRRRPAGAVQRRAAHRRHFWQPCASPPLPLDTPGNQALGLRTGAGLAYAAPKCSWSMRIGGLVAVVFSLVRASLADANVGGLLVGQFGQLGTHLLQVQTATFSSRCLGNTYTLPTLYSLDLVKSSIWAMVWVGQSWSS